MMPAVSSVASQTLDRGLTALDLVATAADPPLIAEIAESLAIHRSMAYRLVRTLEAHGLVRRDGEGRCHPGHRLAELSRGVERTIRDIARPELERLAETLEMTAFLAVPSNGDALTVDSAEPTRTDSVVSYRPGSRHALDRGAPGLAILAGRPPRPGERDEVASARARGWTESTGEVIGGLGSIATWVTGENGRAIAAIAVLFADEPPSERSVIVRELQHSAEAISREQPKATGR